MNTPETILTPASVNEATDSQSAERGSSSLQRMVRALNPNDPYSVWLVKHLESIGIRCKTILKKDVDNQDEAWQSKAMKTKLWTGKTAKQELVQGITISASVKGLTVGEALEHTLDGGEYAPDGSMKREMQRYWDAASCATQARILAKCRAELKMLDRLYGRQVAR